MHGKRTDKKRLVKPFETARTAEWMQIIFERLNGCDFFLNGSVERLNGCKFFSNGKVERMNGCKFFLNGKVERLNGCNYFSNGKVERVNGYNFFRTPRIEWLAAEAKRNDKHTFCSVTHVLTLRVRRLRFAMCGKKYTSRYSNQQIFQVCTRIDNGNFDTRNVGFAKLNNVFQCSKLK